MTAIDEAIEHLFMEEAKRARQLITAAADGDASLPADQQQLLRSLEGLPPIISSIGEHTLMAVMTACAAVLNNCRRRQAATEPSAPHDGSDGQGADVCGALEMLLVLRASPVGALFSSVAACLKELLRYAMPVLAGTDASDSAEDGQQQPSQSRARAKATSLGGRQQSKMREMPASKDSEAGRDDDGASKMSIIAAAAALRLLRLSILCLGAVLELGAAAVVEAAEEAHGGLEAMHYSCSIVRDWLHGSDLLRVVTSRDAVQLLYGVLQDCPGGRQQFESEWKLLLVERQRPGTADLLPILLLGVVESQTSCCHTLVGSLSDCLEPVEAAGPSELSAGLGESFSTDEERLRVQRQLFDAAANGAAGIAERLAIQCAVLIAGVAAAAAAAPSGVSEAAGKRLEPDALSFLSVALGEAAGVGLQLTDSLRKVCLQAMHLHAQAAAMRFPAEYAEEALLISQGEQLPNIDAVRAILESWQGEKMACLLAYADWGLLSPALGWAIDLRRPLSALTDALVSRKMDPDTLNSDLYDLGRVGCGNPACTNMSTWSKDREPKPSSWRCCSSCHFTCFCSQACEDDACKRGHRYSCSTLHFLSPSSQRQQEEAEEGGLGGSTSSEEGGFSSQGEGQQRQEDSNTSEEGGGSRDDDHSIDDVGAGRASGVGDGAPPPLSPSDNISALLQRLQEFDQQYARGLGGDVTDFEVGGSDPHQDRRDSDELQDFLRFEL